MNPPDLLTREQRKLIEIELESGETILWSGISRPARFIGGPLLLVIFATLFCAIIGWVLSVYIQTFTHEHPAPDSETLGLVPRIIFLGFFVPFIAAGIGMYYQAFHKRYENAGLCAITDRRALLIRRTTRQTTIAEWSGPELVRHTIHKRRRGRGDIILGIQEHDDGDRTQTIKRGFFRTDNPELASSCLLRAAAYRAQPLHGQQPEPTHRHSISEADRKTVSQRLFPGETLLWTGRTRNRLSFFRTAPITIFGIGWASFSGGILIHVLTNSASIPGLAFVILFFLVGLGFMSAPWIRRARMRRIAYALTTARILTIQLGKRKTKTIEWNYTTLQSTLLQLLPDGSGTIRFAYTDQGDHTSAAEHRFENIPHARETLDLAHRIHQNSGSRTT
ncbi:hypothetical protein ICN84_04640 [Akkermansia glycaniphila]|uniref:hypothetical protein n=1 Tax=Akkermansia glycaniphila TaxID=1679444 RepID=UPI001C02E5AB|nr:hypothetical protein [Akkermansia glycaniphila]MBT9449361.1 hypothetical protein [Akkermansia glycaniphila]